VRRKIFLWKRANLGSLQATISEFTTDFVKSNVVDTDIDAMWSSVKDALHAAVDNFVPQN